MSFELENSLYNVNLFVLLKKAKGEFMGAVYEINFSISGRDNLKLEDQLEVSFKHITAKLSEKAIYQYFKTVTQCSLQNILLMLASKN